MDQDMDSRIYPREVQTQLPLNTGTTRTIKNTIYGKYHFANSTDKICHPLREFAHPFDNTMRAMVCDIYSAYVSQKTSEITGAVTLYQYAIHLVLKRATLQNDQHQILKKKSTLKLSRCSGTSTVSSTDSNVEDKSLPENLHTRR